MLQSLLANVKARRSQPWCRIADGFLRAALSSDGSNPIGLRSASLKTATVLKFKASTRRSRSASSRTLRSPRNMAKIHTTSTTLGAWRFPGWQVCRRARCWRRPRQGRILRAGGAQTAPVGQNELVAGRAAAGRASSMVNCHCRLSWASRCAMSTRCACSGVGRQSRASRQDDLPAKFLTGASISANAPAVCSKKPDHATST